MTIIKDGIKPFGQQKAPRITICIVEIVNVNPKKRIEALEALLSRLESNNQIVGYKRVK